MADYIDVIYHLPLVAYHVTLTVVGFITSLPWPEGSQIFGSICTFLIITTIRLVGHLAIRRRKTYRVNTANNQPASVAASMADLIHHF